MRRPIWKKDDFFVVGGKRIDMDADVVQFEEGGELPLIWMFYTDQPPVGKVTDIRLEDGEITGEVYIIDDTNYEVVEGVQTGKITHDTRDMIEDMLDKNEARLGGFYNEVMRADLRRDNGARVMSCRLRYVSIVLKEAIPRMPKGDSK